MSEDRSCNMQHLQRRGSKEGSKENTSEITKLSGMPIMQKHIAKDMEEILTDHA